MTTWTSRSVMRFHRLRTLAVACVAALWPLTSVSTQAPGSAAWLDPLRGDVARLIKAATADDFAWQRLADFTDTFGARLSGSDNLARGVVGC